MKALPICALLLLFLGGCSTSLKAPSLGTQDPLSLQIQSSWKLNDCQNYKSLAKNPRFPLTLLASIRAGLLCDDVTLPNESDVPEWLKKHYFEARKQKAQKISDHKDHAYSLFKLSDFQKRNDEKEAMLVLAQKTLGVLDDNLKEQINEKIYELSPRLNPLKKEENFFQIARDYERNRDFKNAEDYYRKALALIDQKTDAGIIESSRIYNRLKQMTRNQRSREDYYKRLDESILAMNKITKNKTTVRKHYTELMVERARAYWTDGDIKKGRQELNSLLKTENDPNITAHVQWILSQMDLEENKLVDMSAKLKIALKSAPTDQEVLERVLWSLSWSFYSQKKYNDATDTIEENINLVTSKENQARFKYWLAHAHEKAGRISKAQEIWLALTESDPFNYYGILAHRDVNKSLSPLKNDPIVPLKDNSFYWLLDLEESLLQQDYLDQLAKNSKNFNLFPLYKMANYPKGGILLYLSLNEAGRTRALQTYPEIAFPLAYKDEIIGLERFNAKNNKELILSIMRQESLFDPNARSFAEAFGLLQLIPEKAKELSKRHNIAYKDFKDLYNPLTNIELSAALIDELKLKFQGRFPFYVASYNAGERPVRNWLNQRYRGVDIEFIEEIPYAETQKYVKLVFRNLFIYKRMLSETNFQFPLKFWTEGFPY